MKNSSIKLGNGLQYFLSLALIVSGLLKVVGYPPYLEMITELSSEYYHYRYLLGIIALAAGTLFAIPRTFTLGFITVLVFLGGTISAHMQHGDPFLPQVVFVMLTVLAAFLKRKHWFAPTS
ncbi:MAG: DoxX family protein [Bacteroidota bacterium]